MLKRARDVVRRNVGGQSLQWWLQSYAIFAGSFATGILDNSKMLLLSPAFAHYGLSLTFYGAMQSLLLVAYVLGSALSSFLLDRFGYKKSFVAAYFIPTVGLIMAMAGDNKVVYVIGQMMLGAGTGGIDNVYISFSSIFYVKYKGFWLAFYGMFYGLGGFASVPIATEMKKAIPSMDFHAPNIGFLILLLVCGVPLLFTHFPSPEEVVEMQAVASSRAPLLASKETQRTAGSSKSSDAVVEVTGTPPVLLSALDCLKKPAVWFFGVLTCTVLLVERAGLSWVGPYIEKYLKKDVVVEGSVFSYVFLILYAVARVTNGFILNYLGCYNTLYVFLGLAMLIFLIGFLIASMAGVYILMLNGFMVSIYYPAVLLMLTNVFGPNSDTATSVFMPIQASLIAVTQFLLGLLSDNVGAEWAYRSSLVFATIAILLVFIAQRWLFRSHSTRVRTAKGKPVRAGVRTGLDEELISTDWR